MFSKLSAIAITLTMLLGIAAAQEGRSDITISGTGFFTKSTSGNFLDQNPTNSAGVLASYRYGFGNHSALELNYGYTRNSQNYSDQFSGLTASQQANVHEATADYVFKFGHGAHLTPFLLAGGGALIFAPTNTFFTQVGADTQAKGAFLYGGGFDYHVTHGLSFRAQYRGLVYKAPDFGLAELSTDSWTHTAEPSFGVSFRF